MLGYTFFATFALIATFWHPLNCGAFRTAARAWSTRARTIPTMKLSAVEKAILAGSALHAWHDGWFDVFSPNNIKHLIAAKKKYDLLYKTIDNNDIEQLKTMAASFGQFDLRLALDYIVFRKGSLAALDALIPYARQAELDALCINSAHAKRKDILEHMINQGITIHDSTIDTVLSIAIAHDASDIFEYLYPLTTNISAALSAACLKADVTLIQTMVARANDVAIDSALWSTISHKHTLADLYQDDLEQIMLDDTPSFYRALNRLQEYEELITKRKKIIEFLSKQTTNYPIALALACQQDDKETFAYLLPQCSDVISALRASVSKKDADLWYTRSILAHHKDKIPSEGLNIMIQSAVNYDDNSPQRAELINQYLPQVTDPLLLTDIFRKDPLKQLLFSTEQATSIALFSSFRGDNWVEKLLSKNGPEKNSVTAMLLKKYKTSMDDDTLHQFCANTMLAHAPLIGFVPKLDCAVSQIAAIEDDDQKNGYTTFVHGRNWEWNFVNDVWSIITALKEHKDKIPNTISMRQRDTDCDRSQLYAYRTKLIQHGITANHLVSCTTDSLDENGKERDEVTFMNYTGLSHLDCLPECSMRYFIENHSATGGEAGCFWARRLIAQHGLSAYQPYFDALYKAHQAASSHGEMLAISVSNKHLDTIVYPAKIGGYRVDGTASEKVSELKKEIYQPGPAMMKKDTPIFCAAALNIPGEDEAMYKIRSVNLADHAKYQQYLQQRDALFEKLKNEVTIS